MHLSESRQSRKPEEKTASVELTHRVKISQFIPVLSEPGS